MAPGFEVCSIHSSPETVTRAIGDRFTDVHLNVKSFGATGNGTSDDTGAIQAAFDAAFGTAGSPHGETNKFLNRPVYFPAGKYKITSTLTIRSATGARIYGAGSQSTQLFYAGSVVGGGTITSLVSTNGFSYGRIDGLSLVISGADTVCFNLSWDNTGSVALNANVFSDILTANATTGILIGLGGFMGSENVFINCTHSAHSHAGIKVINYNALANTIIGGGANGCDYGIYAAAGSFSTIAGASFAGNITADIHHISGDSVCISGCRSESNNFLQNDGHVSIAGCHHVAAGAGFFASFVAGSLVIDGCYSLVGTILGSSGKLYIRGSDFGNASYLTGYSGTVSQNI